MFVMNEATYERFLSHTKRSETHSYNGVACLEWTGCRVNGYGRFKFNGRNALAHRVHYEYGVGPIPKETPELDHKCQNEACSELSHLEPVTGAENLRRKALVAAARLLQADMVMAS